VRSIKPTDADTCRPFVVPQLQAAGLEQEAHAMADQHTIVNSRLVPILYGVRRLQPQRLDDRLRDTRNVPRPVSALTRVRTNTLWRTVLWRRS
jgi:hypothetical protein